MGLVDRFLAWFCQKAATYVRVDFNSPPTNWMPPATRPIVREMRSEMQQPMMAVSATNRRRPHPTPVTTVQILHSKLGML